MVKRKQNEQDSINNNNVINRMTELSQNWVRTIRDSVVGVMRVNEFSETEKDCVRTHAMRIVHTVCTVLNRDTSAENGMEKNTATNEWEEMEKKN